MRDKWIVSAGTAVAVVAIFLLLLGANSPAPKHQHGEYAKNGELADMKAQIKSLKDVIGTKTDYIEFDALRTKAVANTSDIGKLFDEIDEFSEIIVQISQQEGDRYVPKVLANMDVKRFGNEMEEVVNQSIHKACEIYIKNETRNSQTVKFNEDNRLEFDIPPGREKGPIVLPTGNVSTRLSGQDLVNWAVGPPTYLQKLRIVQRPNMTIICPPSF